jgi:hypothetical protein
MKTAILHSVLSLMIVESVWASAQPQVSINYRLILREYLGASNIENHCQAHI